MLESPRARGRLRILLACTLLHAAALATPAAAQATPAKPAPAPAAKPAPAPAPAPAAAAKAAPAAKPAPAPQEAPKPAAAGQVIEGSVDVYNWAPDDKSAAVDANNINLRKVFEDMGPVATQWYQHVLTLSNPFFEGRAPGLRGNDLAADYVEFWLKQAGLEAAFPNPNVDGVTPNDGEWQSYRQKFSLTGGAPKVEKSSVKFGETTLKEGATYSVLAMSGNAKTEPLPVVFAGYAIEDGKDGYNSFPEKEDLAGKAVIFFRYEPLDEKGKSKWADRRFSEHSGMLPKIEALQKRHAAAIIMVAPPGTVDGRQRLEETSGSRWGRAIDVPVIQLSADAAEKLLQAGDKDKKSLMDWRKLADDLKVKTVALGDGARVQIETQLSTGGTPTQNVAGVLRGKGTLKDQWVIVGAHFDHVGMGYFGSMPGNQGKVHPGADDNASGTSAMLVLAQQVADYYAAKDSPENMRSVLFMGFTAEESGLRGSKYWTEHPSLPTDKIAAMVNMDMVGRLRSDDLAVGGVGSAKGFMDVLKPVFERSGLTVRADPTGRGPSDHASFYAAGVPVLFIYTGNHSEYHTPADKGYTVNPAGAAKIVALAKDIVATIAARPEKLEFQSTDGMKSPDRGYASVRLGVMPAMGGDDAADSKAPKGVRVEAVSADTSAADAGIKKGDVLVKWDGEALDGPAAMMAKLREHKPGDVVKVVVWRDGKEIPLDVTLKASKRE